MLRVPVLTAPPRGHRTPSEAIRAANQHPLRDHAQNTGNCLAETSVTHAAWATDLFEITFSNKRLLRVQARAFRIEWTLLNVADRRLLESLDPVEVVWVSGATTVINPRVLCDDLAGSQFESLFVNDFGLYLYTRGNPITLFRAGRTVESDRDFLLATSEDQ